MILPSEKPFCSPSGSAAALYRRNTILPKRQNTSFR
jgi:hypothetical protein